MKAPIARLDEMATFMGGGTPSRNRPEYFGGSIPWVKTTDLTNGPIRLTEETLTAAGLNGSACKIVPKGAVLVAMYGGFNQIGRTGLLSMDAAINQALTAIIPNPQKLNPVFLLEWLNFNVEHWKRFAGSSRKDPNITKSDVAAFPVPSIPLQDQNSVISVLQSWNRAIELIEELILSKQELNKQLSRQLLFGRSRIDRPSKDFKKVESWLVPSDWNVFEISDVATESVVINSSDDSLPVLSCTKYDGLVDSLKYFGKQIFSENTSKYKVVKRGEFAYATNHIEEGSIGLQQDYDAALVSPMYTVFCVDDSKVSRSYLYRLLKTENYRRLFETKTNASVDRRGSLRWKQFSKLQIAIPGSAEQDQINRILQQAEQEIVALKEYVRLLMTQRRGLMQSMLRGEFKTKLIV